MTHDKYIFDDASGEPELHRLRLLESVFDEKTRKCRLLGRLLRNCSRPRSEADPALIALRAVVRRAINGSRKPA